MSAHLDLDEYLDSYEERTLTLGGKTYKLRNPNTPMGLRLALELERFGDQAKEMDPSDVAERVDSIARQFSDVSGVPYEVVSKLSFPVLLQAIGFIFASPSPGQPGGQSESNE